MWIVQFLVALEVAVAETIGSVGDLGARLDELETIVRALEDDPAMNLDEAIRLYEKARRLSQLCHSDLAKAKLRIVEIDTAIPLDENRAIAINHDEAVR